MNPRRIIKHLSMSRWQLRRYFPEKSLQAIEQTIKLSETRHQGEIRFAVEASLDGAPLFRDQSSRERAINLFSELRIWDTEHNNGVLIYLLLADKRVEIIADRGIHTKTGNAEWEKICRDMESYFQRAEYEAGVIAGIQAVTQHLIRHYATEHNTRNELPDQPVLL